MTKRNRCKCGKVISRYATECARCHNERMAQIHAQVQAVVNTGVCPHCGAALRANLTMAGWWQCSQLGADTHRANPALPSCSWQGFTC